MSMKYLNKLDFNILSSTIIYDWNKFCSKLIGDNIADKNIPKTNKVKHSKYIDIKSNKVEKIE